MDVAMLAVDMPRELSFDKKCCVTLFALKKLREVVFIFFLNGP